MKPPAFLDSAWQHLFIYVEYRLIESIFVPRAFRPDLKRPAYAVNQDVDKILEVLRSVGAFKIEETPEGITILGYGRRF